MRATRAPSPPAATIPCARPRRAPTAVQQDAAGACTGRSWRCSRSPRCSAGARIARALDTPGPLPLDAAAYAWAAIAALWITGLPFALLGWRAARRAGLSRQRLPGWFGDQAKSIAIGAVIAPFVMWGLVAALRAWPHGWWVPVTLGSIALELLFTVITPVLIVPLFLRSHPLPPGPLADDLFALAARAGVKVGSLRVLEASAKMSVSNAFVAGVGPTRRIVLFDNLLGDDPDTERQVAETRSVLAHEFGHHARGDLWRLSAASAVSTAVSLAWLPPCCRACPTRSRIATRERSRCCRRCSSARR